MTNLALKEEHIKITCHISGKTLWVYVPLENLIDQKEMTWSSVGLEKMSKVIADVHRAILSTDAKLDFIAIVATDIKNYGIELKTMEYVPDLSQAVLEKFSRGEFFSRSVRDVAFDPTAINDNTGESKKFYDLSFNEFLCLQIIHRVKNIFYKYKPLAKIFEVKSSSWTEKFGILKIDLEFLKKRYDLTPAEEKINPLDYAKMVVAQVVQNYNYKNFQTIEVTDTFAKETVKLTYDDLKKTKVKLPEFLE